MQPSSSGSPAPSTWTPASSCRRQATRRWRIAGGGAASYEVTVDPDLLSFLARIPRDQQTRLLKLFQGMQDNPGGCQDEQLESAT